MTIRNKIALYPASAAWCIGQYAGQLRTGSEFDFAPGFDLILSVVDFLRLFRDG